MKYAGVGQPSLLSLPRGAVVDQRLCQRIRQKVELEHAPLQPVPFEAYAEGVHGDVPKRALPLTLPLHVPVHPADPLRLQQRLHALIKPSRQQRIALQFLPQVVQRQPADKVDHRGRLRVVRGV